MFLQILRGLFVLLMIALGWYFVRHPYEQPGLREYLLVAIPAAAAVVAIFIDILSPRRKLAVFAGTFMGLIVGMAMAYAFSLIVELLVDAYLPDISGPAHKAIVQPITLMVGLICCYLSISFILQTKDDFRFIIPYIEFSKQTRGARPVVLDTSVLIDGRIADIAETGILESRLIVPRFVLDELQQVADSADKLKRGRGRRGLDVLQRLQQNRRTEVILYESAPREGDTVEDVDGRLMSLAGELSARVLTNDFNLNKVATLRGMDVININDLANALKAVVLPGEKMTVRIVKPGEEPGQGVGYLPDGTMIVVDKGRQYLNEEIEFTVTSVLQTSAGKMIFGRPSDAAPSDPRHPPSQPRTGPHSSRT